MMVKITGIFGLVYAVSLASAQGFYQNTDVYELAPDSFDEVVLNTNYTSVVEFYAPWCGHCNNLKGAYKKAGKLLRDLVNVGAVNCDLEINRPLCSKYQVEGFPTIMVFRPPKYSAKNSAGETRPKAAAFANEKYQGERSAKGIVGFAQTRVKSYVKRIFDSNIMQRFIDKNPSKVRAILLTDSKAKPSLFLKSLAIDYLSVVDFAYFDIKGAFTEKEILQAASLESIEKPAFLVYGPDGEKPKVLNGELTKERIAEFMATNYNVQPLEGPGSKRNSVLGLLKKGKTLKQARSKGNTKKKNAKQSKKNKKSYHDEL